jgi:hypothetical protein
MLLSSESHSDLLRWDSHANLNHLCLYGHTSKSSDHMNNVEGIHNRMDASSYLGSYGFERKDSSGLFVAQPSKSIEPPTMFSFPFLERKDTVDYFSRKVADQIVFTEFDLPTSEYSVNGTENLVQRASSFDRAEFLSSNNVPVSLPDLSVHSTSVVGSGELANEVHQQPQSPCPVSTRSTMCSGKEDPATPDADILLEDSSYRMTRVDWRWAAMKGFWDKDKKCWIESAGGQAAYIQQRMKRVNIRQQRQARQAKAMQRMVPVQNLPFRSGLVEELPYRLDHDPWTEGLGDARSVVSTAASKNLAHNWFDRKLAPAMPSPLESCVQVFPFSRTGASDTTKSMACCDTWSKQDPSAISCASTPQWFETAYATGPLQPAMTSWNCGDDSFGRSACVVGTWQAADTTSSVPGGSWW